MKVFEINSVCGIRSTGRICTDIADVLSEGGHQCRIAYGRENVPEKYKDISYRIGSNNDVRMHALISRLFDCAGNRSRKSTEKLVEEIKRYDPDVIHLHNLHGYYLNIEVLFKFLSEANIPVVWTLHDCWAFTGHCSHFSFVGCDRWKTGCYNCPQKNNYPKSLLCDASDKNWKHKKNIFCSVKNMTIVTPSQWLADIVKESFLKEYPIRVIHNGIDLSAFKPTYGDFKERYGIGERKMILGVASVWDERKGFDDFFRLSQMLDENYVIVLVGVTARQRMALPKNVIGIERTNNVKELAEIYTAADVFFNPTYEDNYPTVNLEAQACGTPVVTYRTGGSPEGISLNGIVSQKGLNEFIKLLTDFETIPVGAAVDKNVQYENYLKLYDCLKNKTQFIK